MLLMLLRSLRLMLYFEDVIVGECVVIIIFFSCVCICVCFVMCVCFVLISGLGSSDLYPSLSLL